MAGHNKWSKIKRQKAAEDKKKSKIWARLSREITQAAREGGGDPELNAPLANVIEEAKSENMSKDTIERAVKKGTGELEGGQEERVTYEGYGVSGVAILVEGWTDNVNRTVADVRHRFGKYGGSLGKSGSVAYMFDRKGRIQIDAEGQDELELFELVVDAGADDLRQEDGRFIVSTSIETFQPVKLALKEAGLELEEAQLVYEPTTTVSLDESDEEKVVALLEALDELDDVESIFTSMEKDGKPYAVTA